MKIMITSAPTLSYKQGVEVTYYSIRKHNKLPDNVETSIMAYEIDECRFIDRIFKYKYEDLNILRNNIPTSRNFHLSWDTIMLFKLLNNYDRVIYLDVDILCLGDISFLFSEDLNEYDICGTKNGIGKSGFNGGFWLFNKSVLKRQTFDDLIKLALQWKTMGFNIAYADQDLLNKWIDLNEFKIKQYILNEFMPAACNFDENLTDFSFLKGVPFFHYIGKKPFKHPDKTGIYKLWHSYHEEISR